MKTVTRQQAINELREALLALVDDDHSICEAAASRGILCRGFRQFSDSELAKRYEWIVRKRGVASREELEELANRWQLAKQFVQCESLSCDVQAREHDTCGGWDDFTDEQIAGFVKQLVGDTIRIAPDASGRGSDAA